MSGSISVLYMFYVCMIFKILPCVLSMIFVPVWLTSLSVVVSRSIHVTSRCISSFFLWLGNSPCIYTPHLYSCVDGYVGCFHVLAIVNELLL